jgi:hypothetical protein
MATDQTVIVLQVAHDLSGPSHVSHVVLDLTLEEQFALILAGLRQEPETLGFDIPYLDGGIIRR